MVTIPTDLATVVSASCTSIERVVNHGFHLSNVIEGNVFLLLSADVCVAVKSLTKNCGVPNRARADLAAVLLPVFFGPTATGVGHMHSIVQ